MIIASFKSFLYLSSQRVIFDDMPTKLFFDLLSETDQEFVVRTDWIYRPDQIVHVPDRRIQVRDPCFPVSAPEVVSQFYLGDDYYAL